MSAFIVQSSKNLCHKYLHSPAHSSTCHEESDDVIRCFLSLVLKLPTSFQPQEDSSRINQSLKTVDHFHRIFSFPNNFQSSLEGWHDLPLWTLSLLPGSAPAHCRHSAHVCWVNDWTPSAYRRDPMQTVSCVSPNFLRPSGLDQGWINLTQT